MSRPTHRGAVAIAMLVTFLWSSSWILIRWGLDQEALQPLGFAALRYILAAMALWVWVFSRPQLRIGLRRLDGSAWARIAGLGVVFYAVTQGAQFVAIAHQPAATTSLVLSLTPLLVALSSGWSIGERPSVRQVAGTVLVIAGAWWYFSGELGATAAGLTAAFIGLAANVVSALLGRQVNRGGRFAPVLVTAVSMTTGAVLLGLTGAIVEGMPTVSTRAWVIIGWLAIINTAVAFTLWNLSLRRLSALESAAINNTMLIQIAFLAWVFLEEALGVGELVGIILVSIGVMLTQLAGRRSASR